MIGSHENPLRITGVYRVGCILEYHPLANKIVKAPNARADEISASPYGKVCATSSSNGAERIWDRVFLTAIQLLPSENIMAEPSFSTYSLCFHEEAAW